MALDKERFEQVGAVYAAVVAKAWEDADYKARLLADPRKILGEAGLALPPGVDIATMEDTGGSVHLVLPAASPKNLSDTDLENVAGGIDPVTGTVVAIGLGAVLGAYLVGIITAGGVAAAMSGKKGS